MKYRDGEKECECFKKEHVERIHASMFKQQCTWLEHWKDIRDYINPYIGFFDEDISNDGKKRDEVMINTTPLFANNTQAAGMQNGITSPTRPWVRLTVADNDLQELEEVRYWCDDVTQLMHDVLSRSNFYNSAHQFYKELGAPGTAAMMITEDAETVIRCRTFTIGEFAIAQDYSGRVNRFARNLRMTIAEMVQMFGMDNCPQQIQDKYRDKCFDEEIKVKHLIMPHTETEPGKIDKWNKPYMSLYWSELCTTEEYLEIGGFDEWPVPCSRWDVKGADIYGRGPGSFALSDSKMLQNMEADVLEGVHLGIRPPMTAPSDVIAAGGVNTLPGGVTYYPREYGENAIRPAMQIQLDIASAEAKKQSVEQSINKHFFVDLFRMLDGIDKGNITAREIIERVQEKMSQIGPILDRLQSEFLKPVIDRVFGIMMRNGMLPEPPEVIADMELKVEYVSVMAQAQKMSGLTALEQLMVFVGTAAQYDPNAVKKVDILEAVDKYAEMLGTSPSVIRSDDKVEAMIKQEQQQMQMQQMAQMGMAAVDGANKLGNTPMDGNTALNALLGGQVQ